MNDFKVGDKIRCIRPCLDLTLVKVGDMVRCIDDTGFTLGFLKEGNLYKVVDIIVDDDALAFILIELEGGAVTSFSVDRFEAVKQEEVKPKPQGLRFNAGKYNPNFIPRVANEAEARAFEIGFAKYAYGWETGQDWSIPLACMRRHADAIAEGEWLDKESGLPHAAHVRANATMLLYYFYHELGTNDIISRTPQTIPLPDIAEKVKEIEEKHKDKRSKLSPPYMKVEKPTKGYT